MDRTEASDAFDAGSIPVGCTYYKRESSMNKKDYKDHHSFKENFRAFESVSKDYFQLFREWVSDFGKIILPIVLLILVSITVVVSLNARERVEAATKEALEVLEETKSEVQEVKDTLFEEDSDPELNNLIYSYYQALEFGDIDLLLEIQSAVTNTETIRLQKMSEYIDRYENIHVYTKPGPFIDTYIAYVYSEVYLKERTEFTPGLQAFYICKDENGSFYINNGELSDEEAIYIKNVALQADVIDLKNSVNVSYSNTMENNPDLSDYWAKLSVEIDIAVGEQLATEAKLVAQLEEELNSDVSDNEEGGSEVPEEVVIRKVRVNEKVNIRKSASATADKLGSAQAGDIFILYEQMTNGWSRINVDGQDGYIKSEFLSELENIDSLTTEKTMIVDTDYLNVRVEPLASSTKLGILTEGQVIEVIEISDGWCKIKYNGQVAYVSAEFVK